ncbi:hypothetical protein [Actinomadura sp. RB99]|nr:hypothetical protein [Actinomadura sp. RB99]
MFDEDAVARSRLHWHALESGALRLQRVGGDLDEAVGGCPYSGCNSAG